jgi:hypothetical protein
MSYTALALAGLTTGCGGGSSSDSGNSGSGTNPPLPPPTKIDYFANSFLDFASNGPFTALPATAEPLTSYALIRGGAFNNKYDLGNWHTRLVITSELDDVVKVGFRNNGNAWNVLTKDQGAGADHTLTLTAGQSETIDITDAPVTPETKSFFEFVTDNAAATYTVKFFNPDGSARTIKTDEKGTGSVFTIDVPANSLSFLNPSQFADNGELQKSQGYVTVEKNVPSARAHLYATRNG